MIKRLATLSTLAVLAAPPGWAQTSPTNEEILKEIKALRQDIQELRKLISQTRPAADALPTDPVNIGKEPFKGSGAAKVAVIEFSDYQCPFCSRYTKDILPQIQTDYIDTGKIKYVFRDLPLPFHKQAFKAAEAAHCGGEQGKFWEMHDFLFQNQAALGPEQLPSHAKSLGLDEAKFQQCLDSGKFVADIKKDIADAGTVGVSGTPTFLIGVVQPGDGRVKVAKKLVGAKPYAEFKAAIDGLLAAP